MTDPSFYTRDLESGEVRCRVCQNLRGHAPACPLVTLRVQVQELGGQLGLYVATMRELLDAVDALLHGDPGPAEDR